MRYYCVNDRYDPDGRLSYESVEDFKAMCRAAFGVEAHLTEGSDGWYDDLGDLVLVPKVESGEVG